MKFDSIPDDLKELDQWVLWRYVTRSTGKPTKVPYQPNGQPAASTDPSTWSSFEAVCDAWTCLRPKYAGIGFVFTKDDPFCGIDLDDSLEGGRLKPWAQPLLECFADTYAEVSPSGRGLKIWIKGKLSGPGKKKDFGDHAIEIYDQGRFFAVTGEVFYGRVAH